MNYYQILGLTPQATQNEIKRAYFKLLREHSPEKDPEGFRQIREAYEYLKSAPVKEDGPSFPPFKEPIEQRFADQIVSNYKNRNYTLARDTAKEAWKYFPDDLFFLYWLVKAQRACGNTGNSVKNAEILVKKAPDNKWFRREYGVSLMERGFINKAYDPLCKAYEMGIRDLDFILLFANECMQFGQSQKAAEILLEVVRRDKKWLKDDMVYMQCCTIFFPGSTFNTCVIVTFEYFMTHTTWNTSSLSFSFGGFRIQQYNIHIFNTDVCSLSR